MTPEQSIRGALSEACEHVGHWPYLHDAGVFIGYRPSGDRLRWAANAPIVTDTAYDIVVYHRLGYAEAAEQMRFDVYAALRAAGWTMENEPGPETYVANMELFAWALTARKRFAIVDGQPMTFDEAREAIRDAGTLQPEG